MPFGYTSDELIVTIRNIGGLTDASSSGTADADLLRHASEALRTKLFPEVMRFREEYFVATTRIPIVASQNRYRLPTRATGNRLRDLFFVDTDSTYRRLRSIEREFLHQESLTASTPRGYYLEGNYVVLVPTTSASAGNLEMAFFFAPSDLVLSSAAARIATIAGNTVTFTVAKPTTWTTSNLFDIHSSISGAEIRNWDIAPASFPLTTTITFAAGVLDGSAIGTNPVSVGDWVCLAGESVIPAVPRELHPTLARAVALRIAEANGDMVKSQLHAANLQADIQNFEALVNDRVEGQPMVITGDDGLLWRGRRW